MRAPSTLSLVASDEMGSNWGQEGSTALSEPQLGTRRNYNPLKHE